MTKCLRDYLAEAEPYEGPCLLYVAARQYSSFFFFFPYTAASFYLTTITNNFFRPAQETGIDQNKPPHPQTPATVGYGLHGNPSIEPI